MRICEHFGGSLSAFKNGTLIERFECRHDTHKALTLLRQLNRLKTKEGKPIYGHYQHRGYYLWPFFQEYLFHQVCVPWIRYRDVIEWLGGQDVNCDHGGLDTFAPLLQMLRGGPKSPHLKKILFEALLRRARSKSNPHRLALYDLTDPDFRTQAIRDCLKDLNEPYSRFPRFGTQCDWRLAFKSHRSIPWSISAGVMHGRSCEIDKDSVGEWPEWVLRPILACVDGMVNQTMQEIEDVIQMWKHRRPRLIYGVDDCGAPNPLWAAARFHGIPLVGHMHGSYSKLHVGWMRHEIPHEYNNVRFDRLLVAGSYWKNKLLQYTHLFEEKEIEVACPMRPLPPRHLPHSRKQEIHKNPKILIPYEFLADQPAIGKFMDTMIEKGWDVILKVRPDERMEDQLASYQLKQPQKITVVEKLSDELLSRIDAAAGTMTAFLYELLPYGIPVWYLETGYAMMEDMVADGLAHSINLKILESPSDEIFEARYHGDSSEFMNHTSLKDVISGLLKRYL